MRILVTNDDGVERPGAGGAHPGPGRAGPSSAGGRPGRPHEIIVVAPSSNYSGAGAAVGSVTDDTTIPYQRAYVEGAEAVEAYGLDASPGALGHRRRARGGRAQARPRALGHQPRRQRRPLRPALGHGRRRARRPASSGISALAVSLRVGDEPDPWESAADLAVALIPLLVGGPGAHGAQPERARTSRWPRSGALRWARVSGAGLIKSARGAGTWEAPNRRGDRGPGRGRGGALGHGGRARREGRDRAHRRVALPPLGRPRPGRRRRRGRHAGGPGLRRAHRAARPAGRGRPRAAGQLDAGLGPRSAGFGFAG